MALADRTQNPLLSLLFRYGRPYRGYFVIGILTQMLGRIPELLPAFILAIAFDAVIWNTDPYAIPLVPGAMIPETRMGQLWLTVVILGLTYPADAFFDWLSHRTYGYFVQGLQHDLRTATYDEMQGLELAYFDNKQTGEIMSILNNDVNQLAGFLYGGLNTTARMGTFTVVAFAYMIVLNWQLALVVAFVPLGVGLIGYRFAKRVEPKHEAKRESVGALNSRLENNVGGIGTIKAYATEELERDRVEKGSREYFRTSWETIVERIKTEPLVTVVMLSGSMTVLLLGGYWVLQGPPLIFTGTMTAGALLAFYMYVGKFQTPVRSLVGVVDSYEAGLASAMRITGLIDEPERVPETENAIDLTAVDGTVAYDDVTFAYPGSNQPALSSVSFETAPGETVGIVGPTGAGKSTLVKLLMRMYDPDAGTIRIDDVDARDATLSSLRDSIGYVAQDPFLFYGTVTDNVAYGQPGADPVDVERAVRLAGAHEFVERLPDGYDTMVGERGVKLSGGQRQRIAIARAILKDPPLVVLDEATSHVDNETEVLIQRGIEALTANRTTFVVAHRLSTIRDSDTVLVLDDGEIVERGTHEELLGQDGLYATLWNFQVGNHDDLANGFVLRTARREAGGTE